jgi:hypothetical protein
LGIGLVIIIIAITLVRRAVITTKTAIIICQPSARSRRSIL